MEINEANWCKWNGTWDLHISCYNDFVRKGIKIFSRLTFLSLATIFKTSKKNLKASFIVGWIFFLLSYATHAVYYIIHPSHVDFNINHITRKFSLNLREFCPCCSASKDTNHIHEKRKRNFIDDFGEGIVFQLFTTGSFLSRVQK